MYAALFAFGGCEPRDGPLTPYLARGRLFALLVPAPAGAPQLSGWSSLSVHVCGIPRFGLRPYRL